MKTFKSIALIAGTTAVMFVLGLFAFLIAWAAIVGLFGYSRLAERVVLFTDWSWAHFLVTAGLGLAIPYVILLATAGF